MIGWLDAASGASGDMLLGALLDAGADLGTIQAAVASVAPEPISIEPERVRRGALAALRAHVSVSDSHTHRGLSDVLAIIDAACVEGALDAAVAEHARVVFTRLATAEATVHATTVDEVHFHEVGALDAIADIVGACAGFVSLGLSALHCSPVAVGSGTVSTSHGVLSVPPPAVVALLRGVPTYAGQAAFELCTPTGAALLTHWVSAWGPQPPMAVASVGVGAGGRDLPEQPNVLRLLVGEPVDAAYAGGSNAPPALVIETNVDDLDPRLWPRVLALLLKRGASDAWLTPIVMKKGRSAHTLSVLVRADRAGPVRATIFAETTAIGLREHSVSKHELDREVVTVSVWGEPVRVKVARPAGGDVVNRQPEYDDVVAAADALGRPAKVVLAEAVTQAAALR